MKKITNLSGLHHVAISVGNVGRSLEFYERLGFKKAFCWADPNGESQIIHLVLGGFILEVFAYREGNDGGLSSRSLEEDLKFRGVRHIGIRVPDIQRALRDIQAAGIA